MKLYCLHIEKCEGKTNKIDKSRLQRETYLLTIYTYNRINADEALAYATALRRAFKPSKQSTRCHCNNAGSFIRQKKESPFLMI